MLTFARAALRSVFIRGPFRIKGLCDLAVKSLIKVSSVSRPGKLQEAEVLEAAKVMKPCSELNLRGEVDL
jgi:hypothetical protein